MTLLLTSCRMYIHTCKHDTYRLTAHYKYRKELVVTRLRLCKAFLPRVLFCLPSGPSTARTVTLNPTAIFNSGLRPASLLGCWSVFCCAYGFIPCRCKATKHVSFLHGQMCGRFPRSLTSSLVGIHCNICLFCCRET